jgi:transcriptional regulator with XRE-family HTH domain
MTLLLDKTQTGCSSAHSPTTSLLALPETASTGPNYSYSVSDEVTTSGLSLSDGSTKTVQTDLIEVGRKALNELRKLTGLTWEQLAGLFQVTRRSLHLWASGEPLSRVNEERLYRLLGTIRYIDQGSASMNRSILLSPGIDGKFPLDLLREGRYDEVRELVGHGNAPRRPMLKPLSAEASKSRRPQKPEELIGALHDPYYEMGRARPDLAIKIRKNDNGQ